MQKIDDNTYIINSGMGAVVRFGAAGKDKTPAHSQPKLLPSSSDSEEWCNWGDDNLYPKRLMEKVEKVGYHYARGGSFLVEIQSPETTKFEVYNSVYPYFASLIEMYNPNADIENYE